MTERPAWSEAFDPGKLTPVEPIPAIDTISADWAWGGSDGTGVRMAVIDSGIDSRHPGLGIGVQGYATIEPGDSGAVVTDRPHEDVFGHGTACAGVIRSLAPACEIYSVRVLGPRLRGSGEAFVAGLRWALENGMDVCNLSLGTTRRDHATVLHELADEAYFKNVALVTAANNMPMVSLPSLFSAVVSVAAHGADGVDDYYYNPKPPVEFGAPGTNVEVLSPGGGRVLATGNSYAAPYISGRIALMRAKHPGLTVFQVKTILRALAANVRTER